MKEQNYVDMFIKKLIYEYGYLEHDIKINTLNYKIGDITFIPDLIVYKNNKPYIVIELKSKYEHNIFVKIFDTIFNTSQILKAPYFVLASNDYIEAYKIIDGIPTSIADIPREKIKFKRATCRFPQTTNNLS